MFRKVIALRDANWGRVASHAWDSSRYDGLKLRTISRPRMPKLRLPDTFTSGDRPRSACRHSMPAKESGETRIALLEVKDLEKTYIARRRTSAINKLAFSIEENASY
jgi:hypothetical protein